MRPLLFASAFAVFMFPACAPSTPDDSSTIDVPKDTSIPDGSPEEDTGSPDNQLSDKSDEESAKQLSVGDKAPDFRLPDQTGKQRSLGDLLANGKVALVFYRSADW